jgi:hypothetical protein
VLLFFLLASSPLAEALAVEAPEPNACAFEVLMESRKGEGEELELVTVRFDPETETLEAFGADGEKIESPDGEGDAEGPDASLGLTIYADVAEKLNLSWVQSSGPMTYIAEDLPEGSVDMGGEDISRNMRLTMTVAEVPGGHFVERYSAVLTKPKRIKMVARIRRLDQNTEFAMIQGRPRPVRQQVEGEISALGKTQSFSVDAAYEYGACTDAEG